MRAKRRRKRAKAKTRIGRVSRTMNEIMTIGGAGGTKTEEPVEVTGKQNKEDGAAGVFWRVFWSAF